MPSVENERRETSVAGKFEIYKERVASPGSA